LSCEKIVVMEEVLEKKYRKNYLVSLVGILISALLIVFAIKKVDLSITWIYIKKADYYYFLLAVVVYVIGFIPRGLRWKLMLKPIKIIPMSVITSSILIGYMANNILPARLGELIRAYTLGKYENISKTMAIASIGIERIFDGLVIVGILIVTILYHPFDGEQSLIINKVRYLSLIIFLSALIFILIGRLFYNYLKRGFQKNNLLTSSNLKRCLMNNIINIIESLKFIRFDTYLLIIILLSVIVWIFDGLTFYIMLKAMGLYWDPVMAFFCMAFVNLGLIVPSAPGYFGVYHGLVIISLSFFGITTEQALAYGSIVHIGQYFSIMFIGIIALNFFKRKLIVTISLKAN